MVAASGYSPSVLSIIPYVSATIGDEYYCNSHLNGCFERQFTIGHL